MSEALRCREEVKIDINSTWCKACGICVELCPKRVLGSDSRGKAVVVDASRCTRCGICEVHCPDLAITIGVR